MRQSCLAQNLRDLTTGVISATLEGDLSAIEDSMREFGKTLEDDTKETLSRYDDYLHEIGRDFDDALHAQLIQPLMLFRK